MMTSNIMQEKDDVYIIALLGSASLCWGGGDGTVKSLFDRVSMIIR